MAGPTPTPGIHHVTCIVDDPQEDLDFWVETLELRLIKRFINQDDPSTYHFLFISTAETPGTSMTFFPWENLSRGKVGTGQVSRTAFRVPEGSPDYWEDRFDKYGIDYDDRVERFSGTVFPSSDPDGLLAELTEVEVPDGDPAAPWIESVPEDAAIHGFYSVTLWLAGPQPTEDLPETMDSERVGTEEAQSDTPDGERTRFTATGSVERYVDVLSIIESNRQGLGTVHRVTLQTPTDEDQEAMHKTVQPKGLCPVIRINRHWLRSVYFREFGGVLFELAMSDPGYITDEPLNSLGGRFVLLGEFEGRREQTEAGLTGVAVPQAESAGVDD